MALESKPGRSRCVCYQGYIQRQTRASQKTVLSHIPHGEEAKPFLYLSPVRRFADGVVVKSLGIHDVAVQYRLGSDRAVIGSPRSNLDY